MTYTWKFLKNLNEELLSSEISYLSIIDALIYLANYILCPYIVFPINLLATYNYTTNWRYHNSIKHILHYLRETTDMSVFYLRESKLQLFGYTNIGYFSNSHKVKSQIKCVFNCDNTVIS